MVLCLETPPHSKPLWNAYRNPYKGTLKRPLKGTPFGYTKAPNPPPPKREPGGTSTAVRGLNLEMVDLGFRKLRVYGFIGLKRVYRGLWSLL